MICYGNIKNTRCISRYIVLSCLFVYIAENQLPDGWKNEITIGIPDELLT